jgi:hypothetical protein
MGANARLTGGLVVDQKRVTHAHPKNDRADVVAIYEINATEIARTCFGMRQPPVIQIVGINHSFL